MKIPVHLNPISILFLIAGIFLLINNKSLSVKMPDYFIRQYEKSPITKGIFLKSIRILRRFGFYRFFVISVGMLLLIGAWSFSFGPICTGPAVVGDYCEQVAK